MMNIESQRAAINRVMRSVRAFTVSMAESDVSATLSAASDSARGTDEVEKARAALAALLVEMEARRNDTNN